jgi:hypothetical protein
MTKCIVYVNASIVAGIIAAMAISSTLLMADSVLASLGQSAGQKKNVECAGEMHTRNYCDGYHLAKTDALIAPGCNLEHEYRGDDKSHTKDCRDGYQNCWKESGCILP